MIHVAVGVIYGPDGRILISRRADDAHQGGLWEFPGGKIETEETLASALARELQEELAIVPDGVITALCKVQHDYGDKEVLLDVHTIHGFSGTPRGVEGQPIRWVYPDELRAEEFPAANRAIIRCLQLTDHYRISPDLSTVDTLRAWLDRPGDNRDTLLQIRLPALDTGDYRSLVSAGLEDTENRRQIILNCEPDIAIELQAGGCHLTSRRLVSHKYRPVPDSMLLGASCHSIEELSHAAMIGADYSLLSPVARTASHPELAPMGWHKFSQLCGQVNLPVYALGGMTRSDLPAARKHGARGIAGISFGTKR